MAESLADRSIVQDFPVDFSIGDCLVQPQLNRLTVGEAEVQLEPKAMQVLLCLAREPGRVLSRQELLDLAWDGPFVTDDALTQVIVQLRRALNDSAENPRYIETIRKKGYRLVARVSAVPGLEEVYELPEPLPRRLSTRRILSYVAVVAGLVAVAIWFLAPRSAPDVGDGLTAVPLTTWPGLEGYAAPSPDGSRVVFSAAQPGSDRYDLFMKQPGSDRTVQLTDRPGHVVSPTWSPGGRFIAFARRGPSSCEVLQIAALGGSETLLRRCVAGSLPLMDWSPDGKTLAISTWGKLGGPYRIEFFDLDSGETEIVTDPPAGYNGDRFPEFHPDGESIVFRRTRTEGVAHLFRFHLASGRIERITSEPGFIKGSTWTPDGTGLVIGRQFLGTYQLAWISADGTRLKRLPLGTQAYFPIFGASGLLAFITREDRTNFWQLLLGDEPAAAEWTPFAHSSRTDWSPVFSPSGDRIAFASDRNGSPGIWIGDRHGRDLDELITFNGPFMTHPSWSPDGERIAFEARTGGGSHIYILELGNETPEALTSGDYLNTTPTWSRDGRRIYFGSDRTGAFELWQIDPDARPRVASQVTLAGGYVARETSDGEWLYYTKRRPGGLWRMPREGGAEERVLPEGSNPLAEAWELTEDGVFFIREAPRELFFFDFASGQARGLGAVSAPRYGSMALDPRGEKLIVQFKEWVGADIYTAQWPTR